MLELTTSTHRPDDLRSASCDPPWTALLQLAVISFTSSLRLVDEPKHSCEREVSGVHQGEAVWTDSPSVVRLCLSWDSWTRRADGGL